MAHYLEWVIYPINSASGHGSFWFLIDLELSFFNFDFFFSGSLLGISVWKFTSSSGWLVSHLWIRRKYSSNQGSHTGVWKLCSRFSEFGRLAPTQMGVWKYARTSKAYFPDVGGSKNTPSLQNQSKFNTNHCISHSKVSRIIFRIIFDDELHWIWTLTYLDLSWTFS